MSRLPTVEAILLEIHQSLGCSTYQTKKKDKFANVQLRLEKHGVMCLEIFNDIAKALNMDLQAHEDVYSNLMEFANAYKDVELRTWTFETDERQILWTLLGYFYVPGLARKMAFWNLEGILDEGMPGGYFWYLPRHREKNNKQSLYLPIAQVVDWLLDLLGIPLETFATQRSEATFDEHESIRRSLYNWRDATTIEIKTIEKYFSDDVELDFQGTFVLDKEHTPDEQFSDALDFVKKKDLTAESLRHEIPMTQSGPIEAILDGNVSLEVKMVFVELLAKRYAIPTLHTIRQRLLVARMVQDGYIRMLNFLCPGVDRLCIDVQQNKVLQLFQIYELIYNLTIKAHRQCKHKGEQAENEWFEDKLPPLERFGLYLSILPSRYKTSNIEVAELLIHQFKNMQAGAELEDHLAIESTAEAIISRNINRQKQYFDELKREIYLIERLRKPAPWRALQEEHQFSVLSPLVNCNELNAKVKSAVRQRLREVAKTPREIIQAKMCELDLYLMGDSKDRPKDAQAKVEALLVELESNEAYAQWKAFMLRYKAKHALACNDFDNAKKMFREALESASGQNYGANGLIRGEIAQDCFAIEVANHRLNSNNHKKYYREMLNGGIMQDPKNIPTLEDTARSVHKYFWEDLYKPYHGIPREKLNTDEVAQQLFKQILSILSNPEQKSFRDWIKANRKLLNSSLSDVEGNSILMLLIKMHTTITKNMSRIKQMMPPHLDGETAKVESMLNRWGQFFLEFVEEYPKQLNIRDFKGQTPLMLIAEKGDTEMLLAMLKAGADPEIQDWHGMTALHSAIKYRVDSCVDALLDYPCLLDKRTIDNQSPLHTASWSCNVHAVERLLKLAPELAYERNSSEMTPLEYVERYIEYPETHKAFEKELSESGRRCPTQQDLLQIIAKLSG